MTFANECWSVGFDDGWEGYDPRPNYWACGSNYEGGACKGDYCEGYCDGEYSYFGDYYMCEYC